VLIAILSVLSKLLERLVAQQFIAYMNAARLQPELVYYTEVCVTSLSLDREGGE